MRSIYRCLSYLRDTVSFEIEIPWENDKCPKL
jgi:hypothetical protein